MDTNKSLFSLNGRSLLWATMFGMFFVSPAYGGVDCFCDDAGCSNGDGIVYSSGGFNYDQCNTLNGKPYPAPNNIPDQPSTPIPPEKTKTTSQKKTAFWTQSALDHLKLGDKLRKRGKSHGEIMLTIAALTSLQSNKGLAKSCDEKSGEAQSSEYEPSDLPAWDFDISAQGSASKSEIELAPSLGLESDVKSLGLAFSGAKENFLIQGQIGYNSITGTGNDDGDDSDSFSLLLMPGYTVFNHKNHGINLHIDALLQFYQNDLTIENGDQDRYVLGFMVTGSAATSIGGFGLGYTFRHDKNLEDDEEITGKDYLNLNLISFDYILPLTKTFFITTDISYVWIMDMPDDAIDKAGLDFAVALGYMGWKNWTASLEYEKSIDGFESQGVNLSIGYRW